MTTRAAIHNHSCKHAAAADSKVELTWGDVFGVNEEEHYRRLMTALRSNEAASRALERVRTVLVDRAPETANAKGPHHYVESQ